MSLPTPGPGESVWGRGTAPAPDAGAAADPGVSHVAGAAGPEEPASLTDASGLASGPAAPGQGSSPSSTDHAGSSAVADGASTPSRRGLPGGRVVAVATAVVIAAALVEVLAQETIGSWTGITLVVVAVVASLITRAGDRSLPAMMPPLAFLAAALTAGQLLVPSGKEPLWVREALMLLDVLGANAVWVVAATVLSVTISTVRHLVDHTRARRAR